LFDEESFISGKETSACYYSKAMELAKSMDMIEKIRERLKSMADSCDNL
jgi:hypothetical protein